MAKEDGSKQAFLTPRNEVFARLQEQRWRANQGLGPPQSVVTWVSRRVESKEWGMRLSFLSGEMVPSSYTPCTLKYQGVGEKDKISLKGKGCSQVRVSFQLTQRGRVSSEEGEGWGICLSWTVSSRTTWESVLWEEIGSGEMNIELVQKKMIRGTTSWTGATLCECETVGLCGNEAIIFSSLRRTQASRRSLHQRRRDSHQQPLWLEEHLWACGPWHRNGGQRSFRAPYTFCGPYWAQEMCNV